MKEGQSRLVTLSLYLPIGQSYPCLPGVKVMGDLGGLCFVWTQIAQIILGDDRLGDAGLVWEGFLGAVASKLGR